MTWWRRDPSRWARTPIHRYACWTLRDPEASLRTRCFSKSNPKSAQHKDDEGNKPAGMSDLQWMRLQHYRWWKRRLEVEPYRALFGASEDMLSGKGLKNWEWMNKTVANWVAKEMGLRGKDEDGPKPDRKSQTDEGQARPIERKYPKKVDIDAEEAARTERESTFREPEPLYRSSRFERNLWNSGVESPSDSRRPREQPPPRSSDKPAATLRTAKEGDPTASETSKSTSEVTPNTEPTVNGTRVSTMEATAREASFIDEFLADASRSPAVPGSKENSTGWRQTVLDRRATPDFVPKPRRRTDVPIIDVTSRANVAISKQDSGHSLENSVEANMEPLKASEVWGRTQDQAGEEAREWLLSSQRYKAEPEQTSESPAQMASIEQSRQPQQEMYLNPQDHIRHESQEAEMQGLSDTQIKAANRTNEWLIEPRSTINNSGRHGKSDANVGGRKSTSEILNQLPKDDMDFLSADNIRAAMGRQKTEQQDNNAVRQQLEKDFRDTHKENWQLDSMVESKIVNDQHVRRKERELLQRQEQTEAAQQEKSAPKPRTVTEGGTTQRPSHQVTTAHPAPPESVLETGLDYMSRWLHAGGNVIADHFWQDPVEVMEGQHLRKDEHDDFLKGVVKGVQTGRRAIEHVKEELAKDIPASKALIDRLTADERKASAGATVILAEKYREKRAHATEDEIKAQARQRITKLRQALMDTDKEFKAACDAVDSMPNGKAASQLFAKRLRVAADILQKNAKLTRMMIFGIQARFEAARDTRPDEKSRELTHRLLALQDTQLALTRLVIRAMRVAGISLKPEEESQVETRITDASATGHQKSNTESTSPAAKTDNEANRLRSAAAESFLKSEISAQQSAMKGLSDDGYSRAPKSSTRKAFDEPHPLAHSLFRPFSLQIESLGKDTEAEKTAADEAAKSKKADKELVKEVKKAYEDVYGPITVDHRQADSERATEKTVEVTPEVGEALAKAETADMSTENPKTGKRPTKQVSIQMLKEDAVSPVVSAPRVVSTATEASSSVFKIPTDDWTIQTNVTANEFSKSNFEAPSAVEQDTPSSTSTADQSNLLEKPQSLENTNTQASKTEDAYIIEDFEPEYQILTYDAQADELLITSSPAPSQQAPSLPIPFQDMAATLAHPSKFLPHLPPRCDIVAVKPNMLILRSTPAGSASTTSQFSTVRIPATPDADIAREEAWNSKPGINPIDGTTRLSPTGYSGDGVELEKEFEERRRAAGEYHGRSRTVDREKERKERSERSRSGGRGKERGRVGVGGVVRTAIVAGAWCYVVGVIAELSR